jgi:hypothetical protein
MDVSGWKITITKVAYGDLNTLKIKYQRSFLSKRAWLLSLISSSILELTRLTASKALVSNSKKFLSEFIILESIWILSWATHGKGGEL